LGEFLPIFNHVFHKLHELCFSQLGVLGKLCSESELSPQRLAFVQKAIETAFLRSWLRTVLVRSGLARIEGKKLKNCVSH
jgi:hypothetical protein